MAGVVYRVGSELLEGEVETLGRRGHVHLLTDPSLADPGGELLRVLAVVGTALEVAGVRVQQDLCTGGSLLHAGRCLKI